MGDGGGGGEWDYTTGMALRPDPVAYANHVLTYHSDYVESGAAAVDQAIIAGVRFGSWFIPGAGPVVGLAVNTIGSGYERYLDGQDAASVAAGGFSDATGFSSVWGAINNTDPFTGKDLGWGTGQRWLNGALGVVQLGGLTLQAAGSILRDFGPGIGNGLANSASRLGEWTASVDADGTAALGGVAALGPRLAAAGGVLGAVGGRIASVGGRAALTGAFGNVVFAWNRPSGWRLPKNGTWDGTPGDSNFIPDDPAALGLMPGEKVAFRRGIPDFRKWSQNYRIKGLTGDHAVDRDFIIRTLGERWNMTDADVVRWLQEEDLIIHHYRGTQVQLVPAALHNGIRHTGGAYLLRTGG